MDNLCHTLTGVALGQTGLASCTRFGMATLIVAANLPDVDVAVFLTDTLAVSFRRGWTHGVLAQIALPLALAAFMWALGGWKRGDGRRQTADGSSGQAADAHAAPAAPARTRRTAPAAPAAPARTRRTAPAAPAAPARTRRTAPAAPAAPTAPVAPAPRPSFPQLLLLSVIGLYSHIALDYMNSYGIRLLMPFSGRWFYGDALYIVDPWMWVVLGGGVWLARRAVARSVPQSQRLARLALALAAGYVLAMLGSNLWARSVVGEGLRRAGRSESRFMVTPVLGNSFRREVLVDTGDRYEKGVLWFEPQPHFRPSGYGVDKGFAQPEAVAALATPRARAYLRWSRFPFFAVDRTAAPARLWLNDYRYSDTTGQAGWAGFAIRVDESSGPGSGSDDRVSRPAPRSPVR